MSEFAVVLNGVPGAGKTTLAASLSDLLGMPVVAKDAIKESLAEAVEVRKSARPISTFLGISVDTTGPVDVPGPAAEILRYV